jgi:hypothetical protein
LIVNGTPYAEYFTHSIGAPPLVTISDTSPRQFWQ